MQNNQFEKLCSIEHLTQAWQDVKAKNSKGGIDGESIATFEIKLKENLQALSGDPCTRGSYGIFANQGYERLCRKICENTSF